MKNIAFKEATRVVPAPRERQDIAPLQVHEQGGVVTSCWKMSWRERWSALRYGVVWVRVAIPRGDPPPIALDAMKTIFTQPK